jgi:Uma2 family endonuclease
MAAVLPTAAPVTWREFVELPDDDRRELIDGVLIEVDVPNKLHEHIVTALAAHLYFWAKGGNAGLVLVSGYKVRISERRGVMPDVQFYRRDNPAPREQKGLETGRPDLAVEVISASSSRYDRVTKLKYYASIGVPEYWIIDPQARTLERLLLREGAYVIADSLADDAPFRPDTFPGLEIPLAELWSPPGEGGSQGG